MLVGATIMMFKVEREKAELHYFGEAMNYDLSQGGEVCTVFWSHRKKAFIIVSTLELHSKPYYKCLNNALGTFFKYNQQIEKHLVSKLAPPKELVRYQVWNRQIEELWKFVSEVLRAWAN